MTPRILLINLGEVLTARKNDLVKHGDYPCQIINKHTRVFISGFNQEQKLDLKEAFHFSADANEAPL